jgi:L-arabinokinase
MWTTQSSFLELSRFFDAVNANANFFEAREPIFAARAPGRLDVMGGIADYSGALVLQLPLAVATFAAIQASSDQRIIMRSLSAREIESDMTIAFPLDEIKNISYAAAHETLSVDEKKNWAAYVIGPLIVLMRERGVNLDHGLRILIASDVPTGKGVSSSAAIEVASMQAFNGLLGLNLGGRDMAMLCQKAENLVVGAPCGVMDQMTSACGAKDSLLELLCQPAELLGNLKLPEALSVWGIDSGVRHAVSGSDYTRVRVGAFMGYRIVADLAGLRVQPNDNSLVEIDDSRWRGYLANISPSEWETHFCDRVPMHMRGDEFLSRYGGFTDRVTKIDPNVTYAVRVPTAHPIYEHHRVRMFRALLRDEITSTDEGARLLGELMFQSHQSYSACGLGSDGTDAIVEHVRQAGAEQGLFGAKITGGGSGGTVAVLGRKNANDAVKKISEDYARASGRTSMVLQGSSDGAEKTGSIILRHQ